MPVREWWSDGPDNIHSSCLEWLSDDTWMEIFWNLMYEVFMHLASMASFRICYCICRYYKLVKTFSFDLISNDEHQVPSCAFLCTVWASHCDKHRTRKPHSVFNTRYLIHHCNRISLLLISFLLFLWNPLVVSHKLRGQQKWIAILWAQSLSLMHGLYLFQVLLKAEKLRLPIGIRLLDLLGDVNLATREARRLGYTFHVMALVDVEFIEWVSHLCGCLIVMQEVFILDFIFTFYLVRYEFRIPTSL